MKRGLLGLVVLPALAGCMFGSPSCTVDVPPLTGGSWATYAAEGTMLTPGATVVVEWGEFGSQGSDQGLLVLAPGSRVTVVAAPSAVEIVASNGSTAHAIQLTYWAEEASRGLRGAVHDDWFATRDGALVQSTGRATMYWAGSPMHYTRFTMVQYPAAFFANLLWGRSWNAGDTQEHTVQPQAAVRGQPPTDQGMAFFSVTETMRGEEGCVGLATIHYQLSEGTLLPAKVADVVFDETTPFPREVTIRPADKPSLVAFSLKRLEGFPAAGAAVGPWEPERWGAPVLPTLPWQQAIRAPCCGFPTSLADAERAARASTAAGAWLQEHPDAVPWRVVHVLGQPGSRVVDQWDIDWTDGDESAATQVQRVRPLLPLPGVPDEMHVVLGPGTQASRPPSDMHWTRLDAIDAVHVQHTGLDPEVLDCNAESGDCWLGTHESTNYPRAGDLGAGAAMFVPGMGFRMQLGIVVMDQALDGAGLAPPVPHPGPA